MKRKLFSSLSAATLMAAAFAIALPATPASAEPRDPRVVREAKKVEESRTSAEYTLPEAGQVWLVDMTNGERVMHSIALKEGMRYGFNTREDFVRVNGKEGEAVRLSRDNTYAIFYVSERDRDAVNDRDRGNRPAGGATGRDRDSDNREDRRTRAAERARVPDTAEVIEEGRDKELSFEAKADGMAYLYDVSNERVIESWRLERGERLTISPKSNAIAIDGKTASRDIELDRKHTYRVLFDRRERDRR